MMVFCFHLKNGRRNNKPCRRGHRQNRTKKSQQIVAPPKCLVAISVKQGIVAKPLQLLPKILLHQRLPIQRLPQEEESGQTSRSCKYQQRTDSIMPAWTAQPTYIPLIVPPNPPLPSCPRNAIDTCSVLVIHRRRSIS